MIPFRFFSKYTKFKLAFVRAILVPEAVLWKELFFRISSIPSVLLFNLGCNVFRYVLIKSKLTFFHNSWRTLLYSFEILKLAWSLKSICHLEYIFLSYIWL